MYGWCDFSKYISFVIELSEEKALGAGLPCRLSSQPCLVVANKKIIAPKKDL